MGGSARWPKSVRLKSALKLKEGGDLYISSIFRDGRLREELRPPFYLQFLVCGLLVRKKRALNFNPGWGTREYPYNISRFPKFIRAAIQRRSLM